MERRPGQAGGAALADILFGDYNPGGRLPVTFYRSVEDLPPFADYAMEGRTYRYFAGDPLYAFGHGLSYTTFTYGHFTVLDTGEAGAPVEISVTVGNTGNRAGEEVGQLYLTDEEASAPVPIRSLQGLRRIHLEAGEVRRVTFTLSPRQLSLVTDDGERVLEAGWFRVSVGGRQPHRMEPFQGATSGVVTGRFQIIETPRSGKEPGR